MYNTKRTLYMYYIYIPAFYEKNSQHNAQNNFNK